MTERIELPNQENIGTLGEKENYKYLRNEHRYERNSE